VFLHPTRGGMRPVLLDVPYERGPAWVHDALQGREPLVPYGDVVAYVDKGAGFEQQLRGFDGRGEYGIGAEPELDDKCLQEAEARRSFSTFGVGEEPGEVARGGNQRHGQGSSERLRNARTMLCSSRPLRR
jgi:hypothetical protein